MKIQCKTGDFGVGFNGVGGGPAQVAVVHSTLVKGDLSYTYTISVEEWLPSEEEGRRTLLFCN